MLIPKFRFTHDQGSKLLYYGDEFVAKLGSHHASAMLAVLTANELMREEIDGFTKHVGAPTFQEAVDALVRGNAQNMDTIQQQFDTIKDQARKIQALEKTVDALNQASIDDEFGQ